MLSRNVRTLQLGAMPVTREQRREIRNAKVVLKAKGWSYRSAAVHLGYSQTHVTWLMTERRYSKTLLGKLAALPQRSEVMEVA